jgi:hypothetical protein
MGGAIQFVFNPYFEAGFNGAYGLTDKTSLDGTVDEKNSNTTYSVGGFANGTLIEGLLLGAGVNYTYLEDLHYDPALHRVEKYNHLQAFGAVQYKLWGQLYAKVVVAYAKENFAPTFGDPVFKNEMYSGRIRLLYLF